MNYSHKKGNSAKSVISVSIALSLIFMPMATVFSKPVHAEAAVTEHPQISSGYYDSFAYKYDGSVWSWGYNAYGELGDGLKKTKPIPGAVNIDNVDFVSAGKLHTLALKNDGTVWAWGSNTNGMLGDGTTTLRLTPVQVTGLSDVKSISAGESHSVALKNDGTVWTWGNNASGQLGDGTTVTKKTPVQVNDLTNIVAIATGIKYTVALKNDGTVWAWGNNASGQLGDGTKVTKKAPVQVVNLTDVKTIDAGDSHVLAVKNDGTVWAWGQNSYGKLGDGTTILRTTPVQVKNLTEVESVSVGSQYSLALKTNGTVWSWGLNTNAQLGDGTKLNKTTPVQVQGLSDVDAISAGYFHSLAEKSDGSVWSWGYNRYGNVGDGTSVTKTSPVQVKGLLLNDPNPPVDPKDITFDPDQDPALPDDEEEEAPQDTIAPVTVANNVAGSHNKDVEVALVATDDNSGVSKTYYSINGSVDSVGTTFTVSKEGLNTITFFSEDHAGNVEGKNTVQIMIDKTAPITTSNTSSGIYNKEVRIELNATDEGSGIDKTFYSINDSSSVEGTTFALEKEGEYSVRYYSVDNLGNIENAHTLNIQMDTTAPVTTVSVPEGWFNQDVIVKLSATDNLSGIDTTFSSLNGSDLNAGDSVVASEEGVNNISFYSLDKAGNKEEVQAFEIKIDKTAPITTSNVNEGYENNSFQVNLDAQDALSGINKTYYSVNGSPFVEGVQFSIDQEGTSQVSFYSVDHAGNIEEVSTVEVHVDKTAPVTTSNIADSWSGQDVSVTLEGVDDFSGVNKTYYSINGSEFVEGSHFIVSQEGLNTISFYSVDQAGNIEATHSQVVKIDKTMPTTSSNVEDKWNAGDVLVEFKASDALSGNGKTYYSVNGSAFVEGSNLVVTTEGVNVVSFYSVDVAGNREAPVSVSVKIDKTAPVVNWGINGDEFAIGSKVPAMFTATDSGSGIASEMLTLNGQVITKGSTVTLSKAGTYVFKAVVKDNAGRTTTLEKSILVYIKGEMKVEPGIIKGNKGVFTVKVSTPKGYSNNFNETTVNINGIGTDGAKKNIDYKKFIILNAVENILNTKTQLNENKKTEVINFVSSLLDLLNINKSNNGVFKFDRSDFVWKEGTIQLEFRGVLTTGEVVVASTEVQFKK